jgi:hypothetical protein
MWRRPLLTIALITAACLCQGCLEVSGARLRAPALENSDHRLLARSCDSIWPEAMRLLAGEGFRLVGRDSAGRIATFMWADERRLGHLRATGDLEQFVLAEQAGARSIGNARIESAVLEAAPQSRGCEVRLRISYTAPRTSLGMKRGWVALPSSGRYEQRLLERLAQSDRVAEHARKRAARGTGAPSATMARTPAAEPVAADGTPTDIAETRVIRLDGAN